MLSSTMPITPKFGLIIHDDTPGQKTVSHWQLKSVGRYLDQQGVASDAQTWGIDTGEDGGIRHFCYNSAGNPAFDKAVQISETLSRKYPDRLTEDARAEEGRLHRELIEESDVIELSQIPGAAEEVQQRLQRAREREQQWETEEPGLLAWA